jgi:hypothetical protein
LLLICEYTISLFLTLLSLSLSNGESSAVQVQAHLDSAAAFNPTEGTLTSAASTALATSGASVSSSAAGAPYDWSLFRGALQMLQVAQMFAGRFDAFDRQLKKALLEVRGAIFAALPPELATDPAAVTKRYHHVFIAIFVLIVE